jgi:two-component system response regulator GlrR
MMMMLDRLATKLLYVEDDDDLREMIAGAFVRAGFEVTAASSAEAALDALARAAPSHYDVIVTDYNLTGHNGAWLLSNASSRGYLQRTAALVLTSERRPPGVEGYKLLRKPIAFTALLASIGDAVSAIVSAPIEWLGAPLRTDLDLVLYVTSTSQESHEAMRNLHRALKRFDKSRFSLTIIDVATGGDEAWYQSLEDDRVIVTPTLVQRKPGPKTWIIGTLAPIDAVERMLASALGVEQRLEQR